jgi:hypothetical protein
MKAGELESLLEEKKIEIYKKHSHNAVMNMQEMKEHIKLEKAPLIKNLFYSDKKNNFYLVLALSETKVGKEFWRKIGVNPGNVRLANDDKLLSVLQVQKGSVSPFALINDKTNQVKNLIVDSKLKPYDTWAFHPLENTQTWEIS